MFHLRFSSLVVAAVGLLPSAAAATPANKAALVDYLGPLLPANGVNCRACHVAASPTEADHDHNPFGERLAAVRSELRKSGKPADITARLAAVADEDSDGDGAANIVELLTGHAPGDAADRPNEAELAKAADLRAEHRKHLAAYPWRPFEPVRGPAVPARVGPNSRNPIDVFLEDARVDRGLSAGPDASKPILLRRVYLDMVGLPPTPAEQAAFKADDSPDAYERVVDRLLASPRFGERWGRHWMDVWRYSDWAGYMAEVRESQPHIWRWRDWIVESLNADAGYDRMVREMLAGDEIAPTDSATLRATGFLVRQYYKFNRNVVLDNTVEHTAKAFLGITLNCCRCHDHMYDPLSQREYYSFRAFFEGVQVRTDRVPGQPDTTKAGLVRAYDAEKVPPTQLFVRGDETSPDPEQVCPPAIPAALRGTVSVEAVSLPADASHPDRRGFVIEETRAAARQAVRTAEAALATARRAAAGGAMATVGATPSALIGTAVVVRSTQRALELARLDLVTAQAAFASTEATLQAEHWESDSALAKPDGQRAAELAVLAQRQSVLAKARRDLLAAEHTAETSVAAVRPPALQKVTAARAALAKAEADAVAPLSSNFSRRPQSVYPATSTGRRLALARWITDRSNPLAARVAVNHVWARHFGRPLVPNVFDFGRNGRPPTHPALVDWLAADFMDHGWSLKRLHRLIVTSAAYRQDAHADPAVTARDPDDKYYCRMPPRRMEAEVVRDSVLAVAGRLDETMGGPDVDHESGLKSFRRSLYYRHANEKQMTFLSVFDAANVSECYRRSSSVVPQQALALANSSLARDAARRVAADLALVTDDEAFVAFAFRRVLGRAPTADEARECQTFLETAEPGRARERLVHVLFNHNDFVTVR